MVQPSLGRVGSFSLVEDTAALQGIDRLGPDLPAYAHDCIAMNVLGSAPLKTQPGTMLAGYKTLPVASLDVPCKGA